MRRWLLFLFCVSLPLHGWAGLQLERAPCPMLTLAAEQMTAEAASASLVSAEQPDCCADLAQCLQPGQLCQGGVAASSPLLGLPAGLAGTLAVCAGLCPSADARPARATTDPDSPWRPPARA